MAVTPLLNAVVYVGGYDSSTQADQIDIQPSSVEKPVTNFAAGGFYQVVSGLRNVKTVLGGYNDFSATGIDQFLTGTSGTYPISVATPGTTAGDPAHFTAGTLLGWSPYAAKPGDPPRYAANFAPATNTGGAVVPEVRGVIAHPSAARTTTGNGTAINFGTIAAGKKLWAALHVFAASGTSSPTLVVTVQSDTANNFPAPNTRVTFSTVASASAPTAQVGAPVAGLISDTWWRVTWTITGSTPSFSFAAFFGTANV